MTAPERISWRRASVPGDGVLVISWDLDAESLTATQLEALRHLRAAFFLFDRDREPRSHAT